VDYYGIDEVSSWKFEVWNEPNCGFLTPDIGPPWCSSAGAQQIFFRKMNNVTATKRTFLFSFSYFALSEFSSNFISQKILPSLYFS
jgi:beta-xylosidase